MSSNIYGRSAPRPIPRVARGVIQHVAANRCLVVTDDGGTHLTDWPDSQQSMGGGCVLSVPEVGQRVLVQFGCGPLPHILRILSTVSPVSDSTKRFSAVDGTANPALDTYGPMYRDALPNDVVSGDRVWMGNQGQKLGILAGGGAMLEATPWAGVWARRKDDTLNLRGKNTVLETGFGTVAFSERDGKCGMSILGGTDRLTETGTGVEKWTFSFMVGRDASGLMDLTLRNKKGNSVYDLSVSPDGSVDEELEGIYSRTVGRSSVEDIAEDRYVTIGGNDNLLVEQGSRTEDIGGGFNFNCGGKGSWIIGGDKFDSAGRDWTMSVGRNLKMSVSGDTVGGTPASTAMLVNVSNGSVLFDVGNPLNLDTQKTMSKFEVKTYLGDIKLSSLMSGKIILDTILPVDSVLLGSTMGIAPFSAVKYEQLEVFLKTFMTLLISLVDTHINDVTMHLLPAKPPSPLLAGLTPLMASMINFKSLKVKLGG